MVRCAALKLQLLLVLGRLVALAQARVFLGSVTNVGARLGEPWLTGCLDFCGNNDQNCVTRCNVCMEEEQCEALTDKCRCLKMARHAVNNRGLLADAGGVSTIRDSLKARVKASIVELLRDRHRLGDLRNNVVKAQRQAIAAMEQRVLAKEALKEAKERLDDARQAVHWKRRKLKGKDGKVLRNESIGKLVSKTLQPLSTKAFEVIPSQARQVEPAKDSDPVEEVRSEDDTEDKHARMDEIEAVKEAEAEAEAEVSGDAGDEARATDRNSEKAGDADTRAKVDNVSDDGQVKAARASAKWVINEVERTEHAITQLHGARGLEHLSRRRLKEITREYLKEATAERKKEQVLADLEKRLAKYMLLGP